MIPKWAKDVPTAVKLSNQTLNARGETIFEKPSFKASAYNKRCIILVDGFYEHHHHQNKSYPFHVQYHDGSPMVLAGLWENWEAEGFKRSTVSIVTTKANTLMSKIHNNPKLPEPRMPLILDKEQEADWLAPIKDASDLQRVQDVIQPYAQDNLLAYPVRKLRGKYAVGNAPEAAERFEYEELAHIE